MVSNRERPVWLRNARLIAIAKHGGGVRPIAIGEVVRRLTASALNEHFLHYITNLPHKQLSLLKDSKLLGAYVISKSIEQGKHVVEIEIRMRSIHYHEPHDFRKEHTILES